MPDHWPIYIISLADDAARRQPLVAHLAGLGLTAEIVTAIDGRRGLAPEYAAQIDREGARRRLRRPMSDPEFACALSHLAVYRSILDAGREGAFVFEDDAVIGRRFPALVASGAYRTFDLLLLHYSIDIWWLRGGERLFGATRALRPARNPSGATAYTISAAGARAILDEAYPIRFVADWPIDVTRLRCGLAFPRITGHAPALFDRSRIGPRKRRGP